MGLGNKVDIQELFIDICRVQTEAGTPYILYKDAVNRSNMHQHFGTIKQSNLCIEIVQYTDHETIANCVLGALLLPRFYKDGNFDFKQLEKSIKVLVKTLNNVIDLNDYPTIEAKRGGMAQRAIAIGVMGLADLFHLMKLSFTSEEAKEWNKRISEAIYFFAIKASNELVNDYSMSVENKTYNSGTFHFDLLGLTEEVENNSIFDWKTLRENVKANGIINSMLVGYMPTASTSNLNGLNECFEPYTTNVYVRNTLSGEHTIINRHLVSELEELGLWTYELQQKLIFKKKGSIQNIDFGLPEEQEKDLKERYRTVWEISMKDVIDMAADRLPFIDQTQSMNLFMANPELSKIYSMHMYAWEKGLKTGMYYLRVKAKIDANSKLGSGVTAMKTSNDSGIECEGCTV